MPSQTKPIKLILAEGNKRHLTKAEIESRQKAEESLITGNPLKEESRTKENEIAHAEFTRIKKLLKAINHDDDLYGSTINMLCQIKGEISELEKLKSELTDIREILKCDAQIMTRRKMAFDIEKENIMTIQAALRSIPKKPQKEEEEDPMEAYMKRRNEIK